MQTPQGVAARMAKGPCCRSFQVAFHLLMTFVLWFLAFLMVYSTRDASQQGPLAVQGKEDDGGVEESQGTFVIGLNRRAEDFTNTWQHHLTSPSIFTQPNATVSEKCYQSGFHHLWISGDRPLHGQLSSRHHSRLFPRKGALQQVSPCQNCQNCQNG